MNIKMIKYPRHTDKYGCLVPLEEMDSIPFQMRRIYYIYDVKKDVRRGFHSHKKLEQILVCVSGSVKILVKTPEEEQEIFLNNPQEGLYIGPMIWREMFEFSSDAVLLVIASEHYNVDDYVRNYEEYEKMAKNYTMR